MKKIRIQLLEDNKVLESKVLNYPSEDFYNIEGILQKSLQDSHEDTFSFALNKTWTEIKNTFQYNLIMYHKINSEPSQDTFKALLMHKPTYYSIHRKLANLGYDLPDFRKKEVHYSSDQLLDYLQRYIRCLEYNDWGSANTRFEEDVFRYLYEQYGYKKTRLSEVLKLGYSAVLNKTRVITEI